MTPVFVLTLNDIAGCVALGLAILIPFGIAIRETIRQARCKHEHGVSETSRCDAICNDCGKNLGFIGTWRESKK